MILDESSEPVCVGVVGEVGWDFIHLKELYSSTALGERLAPR